MEQLVQFVNRFEILLPYLDNLYNYDKTMLDGNILTIIEKTLNCRFQEHDYIPSRKCFVYTNHNFKGDNSIFNAMSTDDAYKLHELLKVDEHMDNIKKILDSITHKTKAEIFFKVKENFIIKIVRTKIDIMTFEIRYGNYSFGFTMNDENGNKVEKALFCD